LAFLDSPYWRLAGAAIGRLQNMLSLTTILVKRFAGR
jgi:hypothetical protein